MIREGDIFIFNDPYGSGGQHLPDIYVMKPIIAARRCTATPHHGASLRRRRHHAGQHGDARDRDLPGRPAASDRASSMKPASPTARSGALSSATRAMPVQIAGDLKAQVAACAAGERGLLDLLDRYGAAEIGAAYLRHCNPARSD